MHWTRALFKMASLQRWKVFATSINWMVMSEMIPDFRKVSQLRGIFELVAEYRASVGHLVLHNLLSALRIRPRTRCRWFSS